VIAPATMDVLADVAHALGFELRRAPEAVPSGVDFDRSQEQTQFALVRGGEVAFDGTSRECAAFLIGWRDLRSSILGAVCALKTKIVPDMSASTKCQAVDEKGERCLLRVGHDGLKHTRLIYWEDGR